jgi:hypothetical protein
MLMSLAQRFLFALILSAGGLFAIQTVVGCDSAELTTPPDCKGNGCTCEQDPQQPRCRGFQPPDNNLEAGPPSDAPITFADTGTDAAADAGDAGDAADGEVADAEDQ